MAVTTYECSECGALLKSPQELSAGKKIRCPKCSKVFTIGGAPVAPVAKPASAGKAAASAGKAAPAPAKVDDEDEGGNYSFKQDDGPPPPTLAELTHGKKKKGKDGDDEDDEVEYDDLGEEKPRKKKKKGFKKKSAGSGAGKKVALIIAGILVVLLLAGSGTGAYLYLNWYKNKGTGNEDPLALLPENCSVVGFVNTGAISTHPGGPALADQIFKGFLNEELLKTIKSEAGIDAKDLMDQIYFGVKEPEGANGGKAPRSFVCKSKVAFDQNKMRAALKDLVPQRVGWRTYFKVNNIKEVDWVYMPSDRILVFSSLPESEMQTIVGSKATQPALSAELLSFVQAMDKEDAWTALAISDQIRQQFKSAPGMPAMPAGVEAGIAKAKAAGLAATLTGSLVKLTMTVDCGNDSGAKRMSEDVSSWWNKQKLLLSMMASSLPSKSEAILIKDLTQSLRFSSKGSHANASAQLTFEPLRDALVEGYQAGMAAQQQQPQMQRGGPRGGFPGPAVPGGRRGGRRGGGP